MAVRWREGFRKTQKVVGDSGCAFLTHPGANVCFQLEGAKENRIKPLKFMDLCP
jgi:hypothetical protein